MHFKVGKRKSNFTYADHFYIIKMLLHVLSHKIQRVLISSNKFQHTRLVKTCSRILLINETWRWITSFVNSKNSAICLTSPYYTLNRAWLNNLYVVWLIYKVNSNITDSRWLWILEISVLFKYDSISWGTIFNFDGNI